MSASTGRRMTLITELIAAILRWVQIKRPSAGNKGNDIHGGLPLFFSYPRHIRANRVHVRLEPMAWRSLKNRLALQWWQKVQLNLWPQYRGAECLHQGPSFLAISQIRINRNGPTPKQTPQFFARFIWFTSPTIPDHPHGDKLLHFNLDRFDKPVVVFSNIKYIRRTSLKIRDSFFFRLTHSLVHGSNKVAWPP